MAENSSNGMFKIARAASFRRAMSPSIIALSLVCSSSFDGAGVLASRTRAA